MTQQNSDGSFTDAYGVNFTTPTNSPPTPGTTLKVPNGDGTYSDGVWNGQVTKTSP